MMYYDSGHILYVFCVNTDIAKHTLIFNATSYPIIQKHMFTGQS